MTIAKSTAWFAEAQEILVGGVNSPVRAFRAVGGTPPVIVRGQGAYLWDLDGNRYLDYVGSWGAAIAGHAHPEVVAAVQAAMADGASFGAPTPSELTLARMIIEALPSIERLRFVNSGTEATMSALRLARGATGRDLIIKCEGCYHGHADALLVKAGSGALTQGMPDSAGVPAAMAETTLVVPYNDLAAMERCLAQHVDEVAAVIIEPVAGNMGCVLPEAGYLAGLRSLCDVHGALLIFDEVMTGFRVAYGGAQSLYNVRPDLTCLGKVIGGGLPVGAFGGRRKLMELLAPLGPVYQAGTLAGNPLAMQAGTATLRLLQRSGGYEQLAARSEQLVAGFTEICRGLGIPYCGAQVGGMWGGFFTAGPVRNLTDVMQSDAARFRTFFHGMLEAGIYLAPSPYEAAFISLAHSEADVLATLTAAKRVLDV